MQLKSVNSLVMAGFAVVLGTAIPVPALARPISSSTTCQATIAIGQGASLSYRFTGVIANRISSNTPTPQTPIGRTITMTVQRRDRKGRTTTLLNRSIVQDYEQIAPDADYSKLPFTGEFRGKPNDGFRLYSVNAAKQGLYASLRPTNGQSQKMQIVHYLGSGQFVRSSNGQCQATA